MSEPGGDHGAARVEALSHTVTTGPRRARRNLWIVVGIIVVVAAGAVVADRIWWRGPDLGVGSRHAVTLTPLTACGRAGAGPARWELDYAGRIWLATASPATASWGTTSRQGTLIITGPPSADTSSSPSSVGADVEVGRTRVSLTGGTAILHLPCQG